MGVEFKNRIMLAPMAGFSDYAMRRICHEWGCETSVTEMVSATALVYGDKKTFRLARITEEEGDVALQLFGKEPSVVAEAAARLAEAREGSVPPVAIDINMGCPVPKIFSNGEGSALMKSPSLIYDIVKATAGAVALPVTVKLRLGIDPAHINVIECARAAEEGGAATVCVHGRTRVQMYSGRADMEMIALVRENIKIPLIANGDITSGEEALRALKITGADGVAIGRGAVGNPFIFSEIKAALYGGEYTPPTLSERIRCALLQLDYAISEKGEVNAVKEARKQIALYFKGFRGAAELRGEINTASTRDEVAAAMRHLGE
ncbi:MAG: tRNA dihydrouridine synthase DusB [Clostridia bacterium]|nr:tRNA dihydrouridine synthase DusB [Clostridia bacterium]